MDDAITRHEFEAVTQRFDAENDRQNHRIDALEETVKEIHKLTAAVERLAASVQNMVDEQRKHSQRLETLEARDGELWRKIIGYALTAGAGFLLAGLGHLAGIF